MEYKLRRRYSKLIETTEGIPIGVVYFIGKNQYVVRFFRSPGAIHTGLDEVNLFLQKYKSDEELWQEADWHCDVCHCMNLAIRKRCRSCGNSNPKGV